MLARHIVPTWSGHRHTIARISQKLLLLYLVHGCNPEQQMQLHVAKGSHNAFRESWLPESDKQRKGMIADSTLAGNNGSHSNRASNRRCSDPSCEISITSESSRLTIQTIEFTSHTSLRHTFYDADGMKSARQLLRYAGIRQTTVRYRAGEIADW